MNDLSLPQLIEAVLFYKGEPTKKSVLAKALSVSLDELNAEFSELSASLEGRGIALLEEGDSVALVTSPKAKTIIENMRREELESPLGKAGLETLAVIMYRQPVSRADIEYVRGVNCSSILRSLTMRGLIEKKENPGGGRGFVYQATIELPAALGLTHLSHMPEYETTRAQIESVLATKEKEEKETV